MSKSAKSLGRQPWVSYGLIALIIGLSGWHRLQPGEEVERAEATISEAVEFYRQNPDLERNDRLYSLADTATLEVIRKSHDIARQEEDFNRMPDQLRVQTQARFDTVIDAAYVAELQANPGWRYGVTGHDDPPINYLLHIFYSPSTVSVAVGVIFLALTGTMIERRVGSLVVLATGVTSALLSVAAYSALYSHVALPWAGPSGVVAGFVGLYAVVSLTTGAIPGWLLLPVWLFAETCFIRDGFYARVDSLPIAAEGIGVAVGASFGLALSLLRSKPVPRRAEDPSRRRNALLDRADQLRAEGQALDALMLLEEEIAKRPGDLALVRACWDMAVALRDPKRVSGALLNSIRASVRNGQMLSAVEDWLALTEHVPDIEAEAQLLVRLGEALLDEGHPEEAMRTLERSLESSPLLSSVLALRVVRVARDLDSTLAGKAAAVALRDDQLDPKVASQLESLTAAAAATSPEQEPSLSLPEPIPNLPAPAPDAGLSEQEEEAHSLFDTSGTDDLALEEDFDPALSTTGNSSMALDPNALSSGAIQRKFDAELPESLMEDLAAQSKSGLDPLEGLDPNAIAIDALTRDDESEETHPQAGDTGTEPTLSELGETAASSELAAPPRRAAGKDESEVTDTMMVEASDGQAEAAISATPGFAQAPGSSAEVDPPLPDTKVRLDTEIQFDAEPNAASRAVPKTQAQAANPPPALQDAPSAPNASAQVTAKKPTPPPRALRRINVVSGVPESLSPRGLGIRIDGRPKKSRVPFSRIQALSVAAVGGIAERPVIVVDLVINYLDKAAPTLRVIRIRSDRFNPLSLTPGMDSPLDAMRAFLGEILAQSTAVPLPNAPSARGEKLQVYADLKTYQLEALEATD